MSEKYLGKINKVRFGLDGEGAFGLYLDFQFDGSCGIGYRDSFWAERPERAQWTIEDQDCRFATICKNLIEALKLAKKKDVHELEGVPVEITLTSRMGGLESWRVLTEVL